MLTYLRFELRRLVREPRLFLFTVFTPVITYAVMTSVGGAKTKIDGIDLAAELMIGMAAYGAVFGVLSVGVAVSTERTIGWLRQLRLTPLPPRHVVLVKAALASLSAIPSVLAVGLAGRLEHHVSLPPSRWLAIVALMWLGTLPFALLGLALGYGTSPNLAQPVSFLSFFCLAVLGGLLFPVAALPHGLQTLAHTLPTNRYAELGWRAAAGQLPGVTGTAILLGWTVLFAALACAAYRRSAATR